MQKAESGIRKIVIKSFKENVNLEVALKLKQKQKRIARGLKSKSVMETGLENGVKSIRNITKNIIENGINRTGNTCLELGMIITQNPKSNCERGKGLFFGNTVKMGLGSLKETILLVRNAGLKKMLRYITLIGIRQITLWKILQCSVINAISRCISSFPLRIG